MSLSFDIRILFLSLYCYVTAAGIIYISFFMAQFLNANTGDPFESVYVCVHNYVEVSLWSIDWIGTSFNTWHEYKVFEHHAR